MLYQGRLSPQQHRHTPPTSESYKGKPGVVLPSLPPHGSQKKFFVEYNWIFAVKIVLFYS